MHKKTIPASIYLALALSQPAYPDTFTCGDCSTEATQWLNYGLLGDIVGSDANIDVSTAGTWAESISQTLKQVEMVKNQLTDLASLPSQMLGQSWTNTFQKIQQLQSLVQRGQAISYALSNVSSQFQQRYPEFAQNSNVDYVQQYQSWSDASKDSINAALQTANLQNEGFSEEQSTLENLQSNSDNATGTVSAIQAANALAGQQIAQLQKLRQMQMAQFDAQANYMATQQKQKDAEVKAMRDFVSQGRDGVYIRQMGESGTALHY